MCNHVFYPVRHFVEVHRLPINVGFIHVPYLAEQVLDKSPMPSMSEETIVRALQAAIVVLAAEL